MPTPRALKLREKVSQLVVDAQAVLRPERTPELKQLVRTFTLRTSEGFAENFGSDLVERASALAPGVRLGFVQKVDKDSSQLRDGTVDLETGVVAAMMGPEVRAQALFRDRFVGVVRLNHVLSQGDITPDRFANGRHVGILRRGLEMRPIDEALSRLGLERNIAVVVGGFSRAVAMSRASDLIASVPERHTGNLSVGMHTFSLPFTTPEFTVSLLWHPRLHADAAHRWLRALVVESCPALK